MFYLSFMIVKNLLTCLARLVVCVSPNYLLLVDTEDQTCGGAYQPQPQLDILLLQNTNTDVHL